MQFLVVHLYILLSFAAFSHVLSSLLEPVIENVVHLQTALPPPDTPGIWRKKLIWKARWVQEWKSSKTYRPSWRKVWSPLEIREWVPIPRPPPPEINPDKINFHLARPDLPPPNDISDFPPVPPGLPGVYGPPSGLAASSGRPQGPGKVYGPPNSGPTSSGGPQGPPPPQGSLNGWPAVSDGGLPPFRPMPIPSPPPRKYGPPASGSTALLPVAPGNPPADWPAQDMQTLLSSYHTIRESDDLTNFQDSEQPPNNYHANPDSEPRQLSEFFEPPKSASEQKQYETSSQQQFSGNKDNHQQQVSPYAAKLAEAVIKEKLKQSQKSTERPSGLTDVVYRTDSSRSAKSIPATENPSNVYIVTPVPFG